MVKRKHLGPTFGGGSYERETKRIIEASIEFEKSLKKKQKTFLFPRLIGYIRSIFKTK